MPFFVSFLTFSTSLKTVLNNSHLFFIPNRLWQVFLSLDSSLLIPRQIFIQQHGSGHQKSELQDKMDKRLYWNKREWKPVCKQVSTSVKGRDIRFKYSVVQLGGGFHSMRALWQSGITLGWERQKDALDTIKYLKTSGNFQATSWFWFISIFL